MNREMIQEMRSRVATDIEGLFGMVDDNGDGFISKDELLVKIAEGFEPLPPGMADGLTGDQQMEKFFEIADTNGDGKISKDELVGFFNKMLDELEAKL